MQTNQNDPTPESLIIHTTHGYKSLLTKRSFAKAEIICELPRTATHASPSQYTVQIGENRHIEIGTLAYANHSCSPNINLDTTRMLVAAARPIRSGEELTFFYPSTEWEMVNPFICLCGSPNCIHVVAGAKFLPLSVLERYYINPHIRAMILALLAGTDAFLLPTKNQPSHSAVRS